MGEPHATSGLTVEEVAAALLVLVVGLFLDAVHAVLLQAGRPGGDERVRRLP
ncbi:hypothetical protein [Streptomyces sp. NPDC046261]|uniref:hypothetical protein n=1 Tax=Streptomyces sp. NPDC046261 TaxID=3157200 RepID=UPI00340829EF